MSISKLPAIALAVAAALPGLGSQASERAVFTAINDGDAATIFEGAYKSNGRVRTPTVGFAPPAADLDAFAGGIHARLANKTVGYAFVIAKHSQLARQGHNGYARAPIVDGSVPFTVNTDVNVFSVSKTLTAIAMFRLMEQLDVDPDDPIADWLPPAWSPGLGFDSNGITFYDLLTHRTGIKETILVMDGEDPTFDAGSTNTYDGIKAIVENGIEPQFIGTGDGGYAQSTYKNANFKLAAIIVWRMALANGDVTNNDELTGDANSAAAYMRYVRKNVLQPSGVDGFCYPTGPASQQALAYDINFHQFPMQFVQGRSMGGSMWSCGPKSWWLSAKDLAAIAAYLRAGLLISPESLALMKSLKMGWTENSQPQNDMVWHGGLGKWGDSNRTMVRMPFHPLNPTPGLQYFSVNTSSRLRSCMMSLPGGLDATLVMNSYPSVGSTSACGILKASYEAAL